MKILLDNIIYSKSIQGGIANYWYELSNYLLKKTNEDVYFYEEIDSISNFYRKQLKINSEKIISNNKIVNIPIINRLTPVRVNKNKIEDSLLYHSSFYRSIEGIKNVKEITTVHDFTHDYFFPIHKKIFHNHLKYNSIKRSKGIICVSENTFNDLKKFCPSTNNQKVEIIYNGVSEDYYKIDKDDTNYLNYLNSSQIQTPYLLYVGSRAGYKNFSFVAKLFNELSNINLVIVGNDLSKAELNLFKKEQLKNIIVRCNVNNSELNELYNFAHALLYPSSYEGFGIPIIEAMKTGCPVLSLKNSSIIEVSGNAAILMEQLSISKFKTAITELHKESVRNEFSEKGIINSMRFNWNKCCKETHDFYSEIYKLD